MLKKAGQARIGAELKTSGCRRHAAWAQSITDTLGKQTVVVAGTKAADVVSPHLARHLVALHAQRDDIAARIEPPSSHQSPGTGPWPPVPGVGIRTTGVLIAETLGRTFDTAAQLACLHRPAPRHQTLRVLHTR